MEIPADAMAELQRSLTLLREFEAELEKTPHLWRMWRHLQWHTQHPHEECIACEAAKK